MKIDTNDLIRFVREDWRLNNQEKDKTINIIDSFCTHYTRMKVRAYLTEYDDLQREVDPDRIDRKD